VEFFPPDYPQARPIRTEVTQPTVNFRVQGIGELTDHDTYWILTYDDCNHSQAFARVGLDEFQAAAVYVRRHYARCLTCGLTTRPVAVQMTDVGPDLMLSPGELAIIVSALRAYGQADLATRLDETLRHARS
jgi:hypothetical protein